jgi:hypothetical protein
MQHQRFVFDKCNIDLREGLIGKSVGKIQTKNLGTNGGAKWVDSEIVRHNDLLASLKFSFLGLSPIQT